MIYAIAVPYVLGWGLTGPAVQALVTRAVPASEQGILQGAISSTRTATGIAASPVSGSLFAYFISTGAPLHIPALPIWSAQSSSPPVSSSRSCRTPGGSA